VDKRTDPGQPPDPPGTLKATIASASSLVLLTVTPAFKLNVVGPFDSYEVRRFVYAMLVVGFVAVLLTGILWWGSDRRLHRTLSLSAAVMLALFQWRIFTRAGELAAPFLGDVLGLGVLPVALAAALVLLALRLAGEVRFAVILLVAAVAVAGVPIVRMVTRAVLPAGALLPGQIVEASSDHPNIYFLILDMYARSDVLRDIYQFDNEPWVATLEDHGFYVPDRARASYSSTPASIASILSMEYPVEPGELTSGEIRTLLKVLRGGGPVVETLKSAGYRLVYLESPWGVSACGSNVDQCIPYWNIAAAAEWLLEFTVFAPLTDAGSLRASPQVALRQFDELERLAGEPTGEPLFTYAHIGIPHPPIFLDAGCNWIDLDSHSFGVERWTRNAYVGQLQCVNLKVSSFVDAISKDDPDAVVIITGDHGTSSSGQLATPPDQWSASAAREAMSVFSAYRLPTTCAGSLKPDLELVSSFRVVLNCLFDTDLPLLSGRYFYASPPHIRSPFVAELTLAED